MPSIADVYVTVIPETAAVSRGIKEVFRSLDDDAYQAGKRWGTEIQRGLGKTTVNLDADTSKATTDIDKAARNRASTVNVDADTAKASAQIDAVGRDRKATVEVDADTLASSMQRGISQGGEAGVSALQPALLGIGVTMAAGVASALSGLSALLPAGIAGAGSVFGTLAIGLDGVKDAWDAAGKAADSSGKDQQTQAKAVSSAQLSLRDAVRSEAQAQQDVATARKNARQQLEDLNIELKGGVLDEKQAILDAAAARRDLVTGRYKDRIDYEQAQLRVEQADQRVAESRQRNVDLQRKSDEANAKGVDNADSVVAANRRVEQSNEHITQAQDNLNSALAKTSSTADTFATAMSKLSPNAQAFVQSLQGIKPIFDQLKFSIQDSLLAGLGPVLQNLATTYLPILQQGLGGLAGTMNQAFGDFAKFMTQPQTMAAMQSIFANIGSSFQIWAQSLEPVSQAFLTITQVGAGFLPQLAQMIGNAGTAFNQFIQQAAGSGQLQQWISTGITALSQLGQMLSTLGPMFLNMAPIGIAVMNALNVALTALAPSIGPLSTAFAGLIDAITPILNVAGTLISQIIVAIAPAFTQWMNAMAPVVQQVANALLPVIQQIAPYLGQMASILAGLMIQGLQQLTPVLIPFVQQMGQLFVAVAPLLPPLMQMAMSALPVMQQVFVTILPALTQFVGLLTNLANIVIPPLTVIIDNLSGQFSTKFKVISDAVSTMWSVVKPIFDVMKTVMEQVLKPASDAIDKISNAIAHIPGVSNVIGAIAGAMGTAPPAMPSPVAAGTPPGMTAIPGITPNTPGGVTAGSIWSPGPGQPPMTWVTGKGWQPLPGLPGLTPGAGLTSKDQIAQSIITEAQRRGFSREQTIAVLSTAMQESGLDPAASGGGGAWHGVFQQDSSYPGRDNPATNIGAFFDRLGAPGSDIWAQIFKLQQGTPLGAPNARSAYLSEIQSKSGSATALFDRLAGGGGLTSLPVPALPAPGVIPTAGLPDAHGAKVQVAYLTELANKLGLSLTAGKNDHVDDGLNHPKGLAGDFGIPGMNDNDPKKLQFAQFLSQNFGDLLNELIYSDPNFSGTISMGKPHQYDADTLSEHRNHVHASVSDANAPEFIQRLTAMLGNGGPNLGMTGPSGAQNDPYYMQYPSGYKPPGPDVGQLGQNMGGDIGELFGFDGSLFKNPAQFGAMKFLTGFLGGMLGMSSGGGGKSGGGMPGWMWGAAGGDGASLPGGGGDVLGGLLSNVPQAFGALKIGAGPDAPGQFMPTMPDQGGANTILPGDVMASPYGQTGAPGTAGPGNTIDNSININGNVGMDPKGLTQHLDAQRNARARQPLRALPGHG